MKFQCILFINKKVYLWLQILLSKFILKARINYFSNQIAKVYLTLKQLIQFFRKLFDLYNEKRHISNLKLTSCHSRFKMGNDHFVKNYFVKNHKVDQKSDHPSLHRKD